MSVHTRSNWNLEVLVFVFTEPLCSLYSARMKIKTAGGLLTSSAGGGFSKRKENNVYVEVRF